MTARKIAIVFSLGLGLLLASGQSGRSNSLLSVPGGSSNFSFTINPTSSDYLAMDAVVGGGRDPSLCASCTSGWSDTFSVKMYDQSENLLASYQGTDFFFQNCCSTTHNSAPPFYFVIPPGTANFTITNQLSITGLLATEGELRVFANSPMSQTPLPATFAMMLAGLVGLYFAVTNRRRFPAHLTVATN